MSELLSRSMVRGVVKVRKTAHVSGEVVVVFHNGLPAVYIGNHDTVTLTAIDGVNKFHLDRSNLRDLIAKHYLEVVVD